MDEQLKAKLATLPDANGVYVFKGEHEAVLYIGKARSLRSRVRSYFQAGTSDVRAFVSRLDNELVDVETFVVGTEREAALLEHQLIKEHQPRYNIKLKDDKEFLSLRINPKDMWPRLSVVRKPKKDGARYFGPYHSATSARQTLRLVNRQFQLRTCRDAELKSRTRPCLQYQIRRCPAPCVIDVPKDEYNEQVENVSLFLQGKHSQLLKSLKTKMRSASEHQEYEQAAIHRDQIRAIESVQEKQRVTSVHDIDQDAIGLFRQADQSEIALLMTRSGRLVSVRTYSFDAVTLPNDEFVASFVREYYARSPIPDEILLPYEIEAVDGIESALSEMRTERRGTKLLVPKRGRRKHLMAMALENAEHAFIEKRRSEKDVEARLETIQKRLRLADLPRRIECIDISHSGGEFPVAAIVALVDGAPHPPSYRSFHIKEATGGDDYGSMREALTRRFRRGKKAQSGWVLPDLLVVDGGRGQLAVALAVLEELSLTVPCAGIAKEKPTAPAFSSYQKPEKVDRIYLSGQKNPITVASSPALQLIALARDEAHRSANHLRKKSGQKKLLRSGLDDVAGIGPKTRNQLLSACGSLKDVIEASDETLRRAGANKKQIANIREVFGDPSTEASAEQVDAFEKLAVQNAFESDADTDSVAD